MLYALGDETVLLRLHRNDPIISGLYVDQGYWIKGAGQAIGKSQVLKVIRILISSDAASGGTALIQELCRGLVRNRSLEKFELNLKFTEHVDIFQSSTPFFKDNENLRHVELLQSTPRALQSLSRVLLSKSLNSDEGAVDFF